MIPKFVYLLSFLYTINIASAIQCYSCDSSKNIACNVGILSFTQNVVDCSASDGSFLGSVASILPKNCVKLVARGRDGTEYIARSCGLNTGPINNCDIMAKTLQFAQDKEVQSMDCYTCDGEKCNSASSFSSMAVVGVLAACFLFLF